MKKMLVTAGMIAVCAVSFAGLWTPANELKTVPAEKQPTLFNVKSTTAPTVEHCIPTVPPIICAAEHTAPEVIEVSTEKEESPAEPLPTEASSQAAPETPIAPVEPTPATQVTTASSDPYHTDIYPDNVYSEELIYDPDGNLIGKTTTYPTAFGTDTIWIDGRAYYDLPGFGLIEWSGPSRCTEDYTMYESGVKVGIMGGADETLASSRRTSQPTEPPFLIEETTDQSINTRPEKNSTQPDYKPNLTPPADPNARDIG